MPKSSLKDLLPPEAGSSSKELMSFKNLIGFHLESMLEEATDGGNPNLVNMRQQMIQDFKCTKPSDKMLVDTILSDFDLSTKLSGKLSRWLDSESFNDLSLKIIHTLGKELDAAKRRTLANYQTLVALKQPQIKVNVKAKNAIIGQNQQFNSHGPETNK